MMELQSYGTPACKVVCVLRLVTRLTIVLTLAAYGVGELITVLNVLLQDLDVSVPVRSLLRMLYPKDVEELVQQAAPAVGDG
jgi:hypothetical protein